LFNLSESFCSDLREINVYQIINQGLQHGLKNFRRDCIKDWAIFTQPGDWLVLWATSCAQGDLSAEMLM
jgi:hypothetical protein